MNCQGHELISERFRLNQDQFEEEYRCHGFEEQIKEIERRQEEKRKQEEKRRREAEDMAKNQAIIDACMLAAVSACI